LPLFACCELDSMLLPPPLLLLLLLLQVLLLLLLLVLLLLLLLSGPTHTKQSRVSVRTTAAAEVG